MTGRRGADADRSLALDPQRHAPPIARAHAFDEQPHAWHPGEGGASVRQMCGLRIGGLYERLERELGETGYLICCGPTVVDLYLYVLGRWGLRLETPDEPLDVWSRDVV